jgi:hypothetical protein
MSVHDLRRAIEPLKARARDLALGRRHAQPDPLILARVEAAVGAARSIELTLGELADQLNGLFPYRRLGHGGWVVGISGIKLRPRPGGWRPRVSFSRFEVLVSLSEDGGALDFVCHRSVLDHDLDVLRHSQPLDDTQGTLQAWLEAAGLEFAEALLCAREDESWRPLRATRTSSL